MHIRVDDLRGGPIAALLQEHLDAMHALSPPESVHALDLNALRQPHITFWTAWEGDELAGCGALKLLGLSAAGGATPLHGELKSMRTAGAHLRKGVARTLLRHILAHARHAGMARIYLETGSAAAFAPAQQLYASEGFMPCGPFEGYQPDPHSVFMTREM
jgi:putative acetyltransferase